MNNSDKEEKSSKHIKVISLIIGFAYAGVTLMGLFIVLLQMLLMSLATMPSGHLVHSFHILMLIFFPLVLILGVGYILFGFKVKKLRQRVKNISLLLSIGSFLIAITYDVVSVFVYISSDLPEVLLPPIFSFVQYAMMLFGLLVILSALTVPQFIIHKKVKAYLASIGDQKIIRSE